MKKTTSKCASSTPTKQFRPALTPEAREAQLISLAEARAEQQLRDGTASSQLIVHYLKLGTSKYKEEIKKLEEENKLLNAKTEMLQSAKRVEELYADAISAFREYNGQSSNEDDDDYED